MPGDSSSWSGGGDAEGRCLKNAFTAPVTPSSDSIAFAISFAFSFTYIFLQGKKPPLDLKLLIRYHDKVISNQPREKYWESGYGTCIEHIGL